MRRYTWAEVKHLFPSNIVRENWCLCPKCHTPHQRGKCPQCKRPASRNSLVFCDDITYTTWADADYWEDFKPFPRDTACLDALETLLCLGIREWSRINLLLIFPCPSSINRTSQLIIGLSLSHPVIGALLEKGAGKAKSCFQLASHR